MGEIDPFFEKDKVIVHESVNRYDDMVDKIPTQGILYFIFLFMSPYPNSLSSSFEIKP